MAAEPPESPKKDQEPSKLYSTDVREEKAETVVEDGKVFIVRTMVDTNTGERYVMRRRDRNDALQELNRKKAKQQRSEWSKRKESELSRLRTDMEKAREKLETRGRRVKQRANLASEDVLREHERLRALLDRKQKEAMQKISLRKREQLHKLKEAYQQIGQNYKLDVEAINAQFDTVSRSLTDAERHGHKFDQDMMKWPERAIDKVSIPSDRSPNSDELSSRSRSGKRGKSSSNGAQDMDLRTRPSASNMDTDTSGAQTVRTLSPSQGVRHSRTSLPPEPESAPSVPEVPDGSRKSLNDISEFEVLREGTHSVIAGSPTLSPFADESPSVDLVRGQSVEIAPDDDTSDAWLAGEVMNAREGQVQVEYRRPGQRTSCSQLEWLKADSPRLRLATEAGAKDSKGEG